MAYPENPFRGPNNRGPLMERWGGSYMYYVKQKMVGERAPGASFRSATDFISAVRALNYDKKY